MKKKSILAVEPVPPTKNVAKSMLTAQEVMLKNEKHLIIDLFNNKKAIYRLVLADNDYAHYSYASGTWDSRTGWNNPYNAEISRAYITAAHKRIVRKWTVHRHRYEDLADEIFNYEYDVDMHRQQLKQNKDDEEMEALFADISDIPDAFNSRIMSRVDISNIIAYKRHGSRADYRCLQCGGESSRNMRVSEPLTGISELHNVPKAGKMYICPLCGKSGYLRPAGRIRNDTVYGQEFDSALYQKTSGEKLVIRVFHTIAGRRMTDCIEVDTYEYGRIILTQKGDRQYIYGSGRWHRTKSIQTYEIDVEHGREQAVAGSAFRYCPEDMHRLLNCDTRRNRNMAVIQTLVTYANCPQIETLYKLGLAYICRKLLYVEGRTRMIDKNATEAARIMKMSKEDFRYLREKAAGGREYMALPLIRYANSRGIGRKYYDRLYMIYSAASSEKECDMLLKYQSVDKLCNTADRYRNEYDGSFARALIEYADYLREREKAGDDMTNEIYLRPRNLHETYARLRAENEAKKDELYLQRMKDRYPKIPDVSRKIMKRYTWQQDGLMIRPAYDAGEIVLEGRILHHCVGSEHQLYMKNYNDNKRYILVVRRQSEPDIPYITVELADNRIRQWYGIHDTKPDKEEIDRFLEEYIRHLKQVKATA